LARADQNLFKKEACKNARSSGRQKFFEGLKGLNPVKENLMDIDLEKIYVPSEEVVIREIEGELIIVPLTSGIGNLEEELFTLNETGKAILTKLDGKKSLKNVIEELTADFEAQSSEIEEDVIGLIKELLKRKILVETSQG
jgi:hypothetical protein